MRNSGYNLSEQNSYLKNQRERIPNNLEFIKDWALKLDPKDPAAWSYASMSLFCFLYWAKVRAQSFKLEEYPHFEDFLVRFANMPGVHETSFEASTPIRLY